MPRCRLLFGQACLAVLYLAAPGLEAGVGPWTPIGPTGANVGAILADPKSSSVLLGTENGSIYVSADRGETWAKTWVGPADTSIERFARVGDTLFAAVANSCLYRVPGTGVIRSIDGGKTWSRAGLENEVVISLELDPASPGTLYAVSTGGLHRSSDAGASWESVYKTTDFSVLSAAIDPTDSSIILLGTRPVAYKSVDRGKTFLPMRHLRYRLDPSFGYLSTDLPQGYGTGFFFDPTSPGVVYAQSWGGLFQSRDHGETWALFATGLGPLILDPARPGSLYGASLLGEISTGVSPGIWSRVGGTPPAEFDRGISPLAADPGTPSRLYAGTRWGPFRSDDGGRTWSSLSATLRDLPVTAFAYDPRDPLISYTAQNERGIFRSADGGSHWIPTGFTDPRAAVLLLSVDPFDSKNILGVISDTDSIRNKLARSTDAGENWSRAVVYANDFKYDPPWPHLLVPDPSASGNWYLGYVDNVSLTRDGGLLWESVPLKNPYGIPPPPRVLGVAADRREPGLAYAAGPAGFFRTTDHGASWKFIDGNPWNLETLAIGTDPLSSLYGTTRAGLVNPVRGLLWDQKVYSSPTEPLNGVTVDPSSGAIYVTTRTRLYRSADSGATWQSLGDGLPAILPSGISVHPKDGRIAVMTQAGVFEREVCGDATGLCLGGRFLVKARWTTPDGRSGDASAVPLSGDSGYFWFFSPNNVEMVVKTVDGCALNSRIWTFAAGLTNVKVVMTVTDSRTGTVRTWVNPQGTAFQPIQDTAAFEACPAAPQGDPSSPPSSGASAGQLTAGAPCAPDATTLCLNAGRFRVRAEWTTPDGRAGRGQAAGLTADTGYFWFFGAGSAELIVKVVSGCGLNSRYWTFAGGLTDVAVVLTVTDTLTGDVRTYTNPQGTAFAPIQDSAAFATCP